MLLDGVLGTETVAAAAPPGFDTRFAAMEGAFAHDAGRSTSFALGRLAPDTVLMRWRVTADAQLPELLTLSPLTTAAQLVSIRYSAARDQLVAFSPQGAYAVVAAGSAGSPLQLQLLEAYPVLRGVMPFAMGVVDRCD